MPADPDDGATGDPDDGADPAAHLREDDIAPGYVRPAYGEYCFSAVPATAAAVLGADPHVLDLGHPLPGDVLAGVDTGGSGDTGGSVDNEGGVDTGGISTVVVLLVDGLGWEQFHRDAGEHALLSRLADRATLTPLTGIYPTETAACVTTMHTGALPAEHAVLGWDVYLPDQDAYVETLPYRLFPDGPSLEQALGPDFDVGDLVRADPIYPRLADAGLASTAIQPASTAGPYSSYTLSGAETRLYDGVEAFAREIRQACDAGTAGSPHYVYAYTPVVDAAAHYAGTESAAYRRALADLCGAIEAELLAGLDPTVAEETLILVTADHGEIDTDPATNVDLWDRPGVRDRLARRPDGTPIPPVGGPRNVHLHVGDGERQALKRDLEADLDALVLSREEYLTAGVFGPGEPSEPFRERAGDLLVVPNERSVWFDGAPALEFVGMHGGLHPREAIVPLAACRLADLVP